MPAQVIVSGAARATHASVIVGGAARYVPQIYVNVGGVIHALYSYYWALGAWGGCSAACGGGVQYRSVTCARNDGVIVGDEVCSKLVGGKPAGSQGCNAHSCISCRYTPSAKEGACNAQYGYFPITGIAKGGNKMDVDPWCVTWSYWYLNGTTPPGATAWGDYKATTNGPYYPGALMCTAYSDCGVAAARYQICGAL